MSLKRKRIDQPLSMPVSTMLPAHSQPSSTATPSAAAGFPGFPAAGQSGGSIYSGFPTALVPPTTNQNGNNLRRLRPPTGTVTVVHQEDARDIAGLSLILGQVIHTSVTKQYTFVLV